MLSRLVAFALAQRLLILVLTAMLAVAGVFAWRGLPIDAFPDVSSTQVKIIVKAPGMTPEEVETRIVVPVEQEMLGIPNARLVRSMSKYAIADVTIDFNEGTDLYWARQQVNERFAGVQPELPTTASGGIAPATTPLGEAFMFTIEGDATLAEKRRLLDWTIRPQLRSIPGVADVNALGGAVETFEVSPDPAALAARGITLAQLHEAVAANNRNDGAGRLRQAEESLLVRSSGSVQTLDDLGAIVVAERDGTVVRVRDVARVQMGALTRYGAVTRDGKGETVEGIVLTLRGANARAVVDAVRERLQQIGKTMPPGITLEPFYDRGDLVGRAVHTVSKALAEAIVLVLVLLFLFLGNLRAALVVAAILPLSALGTFVLMGQAGLSANLMSLGGLAIAIGMLVDAAVVVVENVEAHAAHPPPGARRPHLHIVWRAVQEVSTPVTAGIVIIAIVFTPLLSLEGLEGKLFAPVALTIIFALAASLLLSLTVIPVLAGMLLKQAGHATPPLVRWLERGYAPLLDGALAHPKRVAFGALAALALAAGLWPFIGKSFMPTMDEGDVIMQIEKLPSIDLDRSLATDLLVQQRVLEVVPEVSHIVARTGSDELGLDPMGPNDSDTFIVLKPAAEWRSADKNDIIDAVREVAGEFAGINTAFTQPIEMRTAEMLSGVRGDLAVKIYGSDLVTLNDAAKQVVEVLEKIPGSEDVLTIQNEGVQYLRIEIDRAAAGRFGFTVEQVQDALRQMVEGTEAGIVVQEGRRLPLVLRGGEGMRVSPELFMQLRLPREGGDAVPLASVARLEQGEGPLKIDRENGQRYAVVRANVRDRDLVGFVDEAKQAVTAQVKLPAGYRFEWGGQFENQQRTAARLAIVVPAALALIWLLLFGTFGSLRQATLVFANIPFALVGGVIALAVTREYLSVPASVGFIALMGIAVLNGLVLIGYFNQLIARGMPMAEVVRQGALRRLRPVLMTASITAFGLIPLLFATGPGSEIQRPLAIVVIGGLISSTALTLLLLPVLFRRFGMERAR
ncbi:efflux RND transporter permease subunit [Derxia gummosa]|uniref:Efflux RND transporter permease subunit n=1 Tax=Derxia gummosa DSM 723 TaxID=1121388 RepID=A0A8B6X795_9BURK|nr:CusA/CzcA family heavy metal efflux RND transporter [Derxia gummosa]